MAQTCSRTTAGRSQALVLAGVILVGSCARSPKKESSAESAPTARPSILLVTLDTTRANAIGPEASGIETPAFDALAARGRRFRQAYATVPETLPSHASMMTGLYAAGHAVHENARYLSGDRPVLAERIRQAGYRTAAFVSAFTLARRFGLARGFDVYDDDLPGGQVERASAETTDRVLAYLSHESRPLFLWVHYYDPHYPYSPPEPFLSRYPKNPYLGEIAAMDEQLGRLVRAFEQRVKGPVAIVIAGDHGEGLGEHGESQHGNLLYQATMNVPLVLVGPGIRTGVSDTPVSTRRIFHTILDWAGLENTDSLRGVEEEIVLAEAMRPFVAFGWQPQVMAVLGRQKAIFAGRLEVYDVVADPGEDRDLAALGNVSRPLLTALRGYPVPSLDELPPSADSLSKEELRKLASLGYINASAMPAVRKDAPRPVDMVRLFDVIERASGLFVREKYADAIPLFERILLQDPGNLDAALRLASAHSALGHEERALAAFQKALEIAPDSQDVRTYLALHYARSKGWERAVPLLERVVAEAPDRLPALEALAVVRERQGRASEAIGLRQKIYGMRRPTPSELIRLGQLAMSAGQTELAIETFEKARALEGSAFENDLELGVLYLAARRIPEAKEALDRVPPSHPAYPMALFKRAQVSVLLHEPDQAARIQVARERADQTTRRLIAAERLFQGAGPP